MGTSRQEQLREYYQHLTKLDDPDAELRSLNSEEELHPLVDAEAPIELVLMATAVEEVRQKIHQQILATLSPLEQGRIYFAEGDYTAAEELYRKALADKDYRAHFEMGMLFLISAQYAPINKTQLIRTGKKHLKLALELIPAEDDRKSDAFFVLFKNSPTDQEKNEYAEFAVQCGLGEEIIIRAYSEINNYEQVIERGEKALIANVRTPSIYYDMALAYYKLGRTEQALRACDVIIALELREGEKIKADILNGLKRYNEALPLARSADKHHFHSARLTLLHTLMGMKEYDEALTLANYSEAKTPEEHFQIFNIRAQIFVQKSRKDLLKKDISELKEPYRTMFIVQSILKKYFTLKEAITLIKKTDKCTDAEAYDKVASFMKKAGFLNQALECLKTALKQGIYETTFMKLIEIYMEESLYDEIDIVSEQAIQDNHPAFGNLGKAIAALGDVSLAEQHYQKVLESPPEGEAYGIAYVGLGSIHEASGHMEKAIEFYKQGIEKNNKKAYQALYQLLIGLGRVSQASLLLQSAFAKGLSIDIFIDNGED